ncbi:MULTISPECIES: Lrp/AsnC family transcriptional regulator [Gordonia]|uniref:AsnC family transcriptional regulator n=2 Tax=Gordonia alkanivorans TaxID=84096 RepID=W9DK58_9ACTN|nr:MULTISPECIES: AsnC family transcriptional regulator [Gordonia]AZZ80981.1 AsnC family transcriptional regulator [Gordonia alkanivorans]ETA07141.1 AsnC family transcriptional regulator [Gordonia alkanivorans CGMCC 6845]QGP90501.1 AsnC family transcriptional regulator [Gordonia sp. 135]
MDDTDGTILRALQVYPRASFRLLGEVAGISEQTAARRYQALRRAGVTRVVGVVRPAVRGDAEWVVRVRCRPDRLEPLAASLARRRDVVFAYVVSGGTEIVCIVRAPIVAVGDDALLAALPSRAAVLDLRVDLLLHAFNPGSASKWTGFGGCLPEESRALVAAAASGAAGVEEEAVDGGAVENARLTDDDAPLIAALTQDGRLPHRELARVCGWTVGRVRRRLRTLEQGGALQYDVEILPERLGFDLSATLWLEVSPGAIDAVGEAVAAHDEVAFAAAISGEHNLMVSVICRNADDFYRYLRTRIGAMEGILGYSVSIRVRRLKQNASLVVQGRLIQPV